MNNTTATHSLKREISNAKNIKTFLVSDLIQHFGYQRAGRHIRDNISNYLKSEDIGIIGEMIPNSGTKSVTLYIKNSNIEQVIQAVCSPNAASAEVLRTYVKITTSKNYNSTSIEPGGHHL